jgi:hypothetical protein
LTKKLGRPTKFKREYCELLIEHCKEGYSFEAFAGRIGVNQDTIHEWAKPDNAEKYPGFSEAKKEAKAHTRYFWEQVYLGATANKASPVNTTLLIFAMKNMCNWTDKTETKLPDEDRPPITLAYKLE